jgi:hypothetical protein
MLLLSSASTVRAIFSLSFSMLFIVS